MVHDGEPILSQAGKKELIEVLLAVLRAEGNPEGVATARELQEETGLSLEKVREGLRELKKEGRLEAVKVQRERLDGAVVRLPGYRLVED